MVESSKWQLSQRFIHILSSQQMPKCVATTEVRDEMNAHFLVHRAATSGFETV
jgi:hypothetical protein